METPLVDCEASVTLHALVASPTGRNPRPPGRYLPRLCTTGSPKLPPSLMFLCFVFGVKRNHVRPDVALDPGPGTCPHAPKKTNPRKNTHTHTPESPELPKLPQRHPQHTTKTPPKNTPKTHQTPPEHLQNQPKTPRKHPEKTPPNTPEHHLPKHQPKYAPKRLPKTPSQNTPSPNPKTPQSRSKHIKAPKAPGKNQNTPGHTRNVASHGVEGAV